jgi:hypothetical protein
LDDPLYSDGLTPQLSKNIRCFSNMRRLPSSASSSDSAISEGWPRVKRVLDDYTLANDLDLQFGDVARWLARDAPEHDSALRAHAFFGQTSEV